MGTAIQLDIKPTDSDLRLYVNSRLQESDFAEEVAKDSSLVDEIVSKTENMYVGIFCFWGTNSEPITDFSSPDYS
jgi:hypothetical protein